MTKYNHLKEVHNKDSSYSLAHKIKIRFQPKSILDVGCGTGNFLKNFKDMEVNDIVGIDGNHLDLNSLYIEKDKVEILDLEKPFDLDRKFDLIMCLEVAEHISPESATHFVESLCKHGDKIIFSAAIPYQGGQNHLNEQWQDYWIKQFSNFNYQADLSLREELWKQEDIFWWYRQNIIVFQKKTAEIRNVEFANIVHPDLYLKKSKQLEDVLCGRMGVFHSFRIFLNSIYRLIKE